MQAYNMSDAITELEDLFINIYNVEKPRMLLFIQLYFV